MAINNPVKNARTANIPLVALTNLIRFTLSAIAPPQIENNNTGPNVAVLIRPTKIVESVYECISHNRPYTRAHIPILERAAATQNSRYSWK